MSATEPEERPAGPQVPAVPGGPPAKLAALLETLNSDDRRELVAWLLNRRPGPVLWHPRSSTEVGTPWAGDPGRLFTFEPSPTEGSSQIVTIRLPSEQHEQLRTWCAENNFSMAAVIRGLVGRFLDHEGRGPAGREPKTA